MSVREVAVDSILDGAADLIERHGWARSLARPFTPDAEPREYDVARAISAAYHALEAEADSRFYWINRWARANRAFCLFVGEDLSLADHALWQRRRGRTQAEVVAALRGAAGRERGRA